MILSNFPTAQPAPIVGQNGNWWVWDAHTRVYVDTGDPSRGETGPAGPQGPKGDTGDSGGTPIPVSSASAMTDTSKLYLYTGSQSGYQTNYVYGYVDGAWTALLPYGGGGGSSITVDSALSSTSENPVQNKVIKAALDGKGTYSKPNGGIPKTDLASAVQTSLGKADTALQEHQDISGKQDTLIASGAAVGQIAKITAVDANGKPTAWEAADMAGGGNDWTTIIDTTLESDVSRLFYGNLAYKEVELWLEWDATTPIKPYYSINVPTASGNMATYFNFMDTSVRSVGAVYLRAFINPHNKICSLYSYGLYGGVGQAQAMQPWMLISSFGTGLVPVDHLTSDNITSISFANANTDGVVPSGTRVILRGR